MRLRTFAIAALLLGGALGTYMSAQRHADWLGLKAYAGEKEALKAEEAKKHRFLKFQTLYLPIFDDSGLNQTVSFSIAVEVPDSRRAQLVRDNEPRLTDAFIHDMYRVWRKDAAYRGGVVHVDVIKDRLSRSSRRILGDDNVNDVSLEVVNHGAM